MTSVATSSVERRALRAAPEAVEGFCRAVLLAAGADEATVNAATRAMMHGSGVGVDSHGVRLLAHYAKALTKGRVNPRPEIRVMGASGAVACLDADNGHGALAAFVAMDHARRLAEELGIGAVAIRNTSHFGPAGAYALEAAEAGFIGLAMCNADSFVRLHDGAARFHGTNPIACAVPVPQSRPWLLDMATSAITYNCVQLYRSLGLPLPPGVASGDDGADTHDPAEVAMLAPLGGDLGFKGAGLAGLVEIFCGVLTGMKLSHEIAPMGGPDFSTPRGLGAFVLAARPAAFVDAARFEDGMLRYLAALRASPARKGALVLAPGDREWAEADRRVAEGIPLDPATVEDFVQLAREFGLALPFDGQVKD